MPTARLRAVVAVAPVLAREPLDAVPRAVGGRQLRQADDLAPTLEHPCRELGVLVYRPPLVPLADLFQVRPPPDAGEHTGVELDLGRPRRPLARAALAERCLEGCRDRPRPPAATFRDRRPADPLDVSLDEALDSPRDVVVRVGGMGVHTHD